MDVDMEADEFYFFMRYYSKEPTKEGYRALRIRYVPLLSQTQLLEFYEVHIRPYETEQLLYELRGDVKGASEFREALQAEIQEVKLGIYQLNQQIARQTQFVEESSVFLSESSQLQ